MQKTFIYEIDNKAYEVVVLYKRIKNIHYRYKNGAFVVSAPRTTSEKHIRDGLDKFARRLLAISNKPVPYTDNYIYILGNKYDISPNGGTLKIEDYIILIYKDNKDLSRKLGKFYLQLVTERTRYYEKIMGVNPYIIKTRNMTSRYGVNAKYKNTITYSTILLHYSLAIIDSVIVHELSHDFVYNHSKSFYDVIYKYYPKYDFYHSLLRKGVFHD